MSGAEDDTSDNDDEDDDDEEEDDDDEDEDGPAAWASAQALTSTPRWERWLIQSPGTLTPGQSALGRCCCGVASSL